MKAVKWFAPRDMRVVDAPKPVPKPFEALIRIESTGVCGSDMHYFTEGRIGKTVITSPIILGHEYSGIVEGVGGDADQSLIGKRVAVEPGIPCMHCEFCFKGHYNVCRKLQFPGGPPYDGALCEYICVHAAFCFPVPDSMTATEAAMIEPLAVALHAVDLANVKPGDTVAVLGLGPIGLLTALAARIAGAQSIYGCDPLDYRVSASRAHGVDFSFNAEQHSTPEVLSRETGGRGVDVAFDCARSTDTPGVACEIARPAGRCILVGISGAETAVFPVDIARRKELNITWCRRFLFNFPTAIDLVASGKIDVKSLITHSFPLEKSLEAFELVERAGDGVLKASIDQ